MESEFMIRAKNIVSAWIDETRDKSDQSVAYEVYVVWFSKTLQNWKALLSTTLSDGMYYEVTHNGDKNETYCDAYRKVANFAVAGDRESRNG